jgi:hypothetical protein
MLSPEALSGIATALKRAHQLATRAQLPKHAALMILEHPMEAVSPDAPLKPCSHFDFFSQRQRSEGKNKGH